LFSLFLKKFIRRIFQCIIAVLTGTGERASKRSLIVRFTVSGPVPCSGARRRGKVLDVVSAAIPGDAVAGNEKLWGGMALAVPTSDWFGIF